MSGAAAAVVVLTPDALRDLIRAAVADALAEHQPTPTTTTRETGVLTSAELAARLQIGPRELRRHVKAGLIPPPVMVGPRSPRWSVSTIAEWEQGRSVPIPELKPRRKKVG